MFDSAIQVQARLLPTLIRHSICFLRDGRDGRRMRHEHELLENAPVFFVLVAFLSTLTSLGNTSTILLCCCPAPVQISAIGHNVLFETSYASSHHIGASHDIRMWLKPEM